MVPTTALIEDYISSVIKCLNIICIFIIFLLQLPNFLLHLPHFLTPLRFIFPNDTFSFQLAVK